MNNLNKTFATFINKENFDFSSPVFTDLRKTLSSDSRLSTMSQIQAKEEIRNMNQMSGVFRSLLWKIRRHIGGGLSELSRDLETMNTNEIALFIDAKGLSHKNIEKLKALLSSYPFYKTKYFTKFGGEHLTLENNHREEVFLLNGFSEEKN